MASRREYELLFQLNASLNGGFSASFQKAQQKIVELQREIDKLSKIQSDIGAYEKQQAAVEKTASKLEMLKKQHDNIQREYEETGEASSDLQNKLLAKEEQIKNTSKALEEQQKKLEATGDALKEAGVDTANLTEESKRLEEEMGALKDQQEETAKNAQTFGDKAVQAFEAAGNALAAAGILDGLKKVYDGFMDCVSVTADFQESMSNVKALSQASNSEMSALSGLAKELGATTKFTAKQSADAMGYMAMAGWTAEDMLQGLPGVMSLAAASGEDLAMVSDIVTDSLSGFGLTAADSAHYADILAAAATSANTNVAYMGDTFKYAASVAGALNVSAEDTAEAIGVMANAGIKGSMAGSSLRSILLRLATDAGASSTKLGALGVLTEELGVNFYDAEGNVRDFTTVLDETRVAWAKLSAEEQASYGKTIAGQYAVSGWLALMNATPDSIDKVRYSIDNCTGAAERMSKIKLDNLNG
ncbi:MAG: phage tail tape measure protein, partial [Oscillospiraceae bacterium]|nr:phage tail tape measure protein [Oscillospiraceae bacterium]